MSEAGWLEREDLTAMLDFLSGKASSRKLRLFACACCRSIWPLLTKKVCRQAIALSEAFADDEIEEKEVDEAKKRLDELFNNAAVESTSGSHREIRKASLRASLMAAMSQAVSNPVWPEGVCAKVLYLAKETGLGGPKPSTTTAHSTACPSSPTPSKTPDVPMRKSSTTAANRANTSAAAG